MNSVNYAYGLPSPNLHIPVRIKDVFGCVFRCKVAGVANGVICAYSASADTSAVTLAKENPTRTVI